MTDKLFMARSLAKPQPLSRVMSVLAGLTILLVLLAAAGCASQPTVPPEQAIVGKWVNAKGYSISFYPNGTGFVPGLDGQIPPTNFDYAFTDPTHIRMNMGGQLATIIEIKIEGDQMTWLSRPNDVAFVYTRAR